VLILNKKNATTGTATTTASPNRPNHIDQNNNSLLDGSIDSPSPPPIKCPHHPHLQSSSSAQDAQSSPLLSSQINNGNQATDQEKSQHTAESEECPICKKIEKYNVNATSNNNNNNNNNNVQAIEFDLVSLEEAATMANTRLNRRKTNSTTGKDITRKYTCCCFFTFERTPRLCVLVERVRTALRSFVDGKLFQRAILCAILINTLSMGIEHHEQPPTLTLIVEYSNYFFTGVFFLEMLLKIFAYGTFEYIRSAFNLFDGAIVCIRQALKQLLE
jgi:hypothetical protein